MGKPFAVQGMSAWGTRAAQLGLAERGRMVRTLGVLFCSGATLALAGLLLLELPDGTNASASLAVVAAGYTSGGILLAAGNRMPPMAIQSLLALGTVYVTLGIYFSGDAATDNQMFYLWVGLYAGLFLSPLASAVQVAFVGAAYGVDLLLTEPAGPAAVHWLITVGTLGVATSVVARVTAHVTATAERDPVTSLPRRDVLLDRLQRARRRRPDSRTGGPAVACISVDSFELVTRSLDPDDRDRLMALLAGRLKASLGPRDTVAHFGDGNFAAMLDPEGGALRSTRLAERISERLRAPFLLDGRPLSLTVSIGLAFDGGEDGNAHDLVRTAETAALAAMNRDRPSATFENGAMVRAARRLELGLDLRMAIERDEFELHYQPKVSLSNGRVCGTEALVRWRHPRRGLIAPADFIPWAEDTGAIVPLGRMVLRRACVQARAWQKRFPNNPPLKVFVNVSSRQLQDDDLVRDVSEALERSRIEPGSLALELTESGVADDFEHAAATLLELKDLGVALAVDDFGVGYSSLGLLRKLPVDSVKIDRSFVARMLDDPEDEAIVAAVVSLARALRLEVVAEGVERSDQLERLRELGCDMAQGFYFARPLPAEQVAGAISARV